MSEQIITAHEQGDKLLLNYYQDVEPHLKAAHAERSLHTTVDKKREMRKVMSVPFNIIAAICNSTGLDFFNPEDAKVIVKMLKRPEFKAFRTVPDRRI